MNYLKSLIDAANASSEITQEAVESVRTDKFTESFAADGTLRMVVRGELMQVNWVELKDNPEVRLRVKLFYSSIYNAIVEKMLSDIRLKYGDIQNNWIDNRDSVVDTAVGMVEEMTMGSFSHLLPNMDDIDLDQPVVDFNGQYVVEIAHFLKVVDGEVKYGEFQAAAIQWKIDKETGLFRRDFIINFSPTGA